MNECYVGGYWYARAEPKESCVRRAHDYFQRLAAHDEALGEWYGTGNTIKQALSNIIGTDLASLREKFESERYGTDDEEYSLHAWNGALFDQGFVCNLRCGSSSTSVSSMALLRLPERGPSSERLCTLGSLATLIRMTIEVWGPEWAVASSHELRDSLLGEDELPRPFIGWITYLSRRMAPSLPRLDGAVIEPYADGHLITLTQSRPPGIDPELVETARRIDSRLLKAGLLTRPHERTVNSPRP